MVWWRWFKQDPEETSTRQQIEALIDTIAYDFGRFTLPDFLNHVSEKRGKPIHLIPLQLTAISGAVITTRKTDYIFYEDQRHPVLQTHVILHEIGHLLLDQLDEFCIEDDAQLEAFVLQQRAHLSLRAAGVQRPGEIEAELFVRLLQTRILRCRRVQQLAEIDKSLLVAPFSDAHLP